MISFMNMTWHRSDRNKGEVLFMSITVNLYYTAGDDKFIRK